MSDVAPNDDGADARPFDAISYLAGVDAHGGRLDAVPTGFPSLDALLSGGPRRGDLVVLAGDSGCGKSALAMAIALRAAEAEYDVALFSGEYGPERLFERALAMTGRARVDDLRHGTLDEAGRASVAAAALRLRERAPMFSHVAPNGVAGLSDLLIEHLGLDLLVVDPVQSLAVGRLPRDEELAHAVLQLKSLAVRRQCVVLAVSHLAVPVRERADPRPQLEDLGILGALAHHADIVLGLYREEQYHAANDIDGAAEVHVRKSRDGSLGYADLFYFKAWLRFEDMVEP
ncbi:MAG: AAA family ATPase [Gemmatimonadaceae bacterium]|nr:AAA family ATPase [Gemmatimonadaceae bacterium]